MIVIDNFNQVAAQIESERGIGKEVLASAIEQSLVSACRKRFSETAILTSELNMLTGEAKIYLKKKVVASINDIDTEITLKDAKKIDSEAKIDSEIKIDVTPSDFGRIAAQTAKQVIIQRIREAEKNAIYNAFVDRVGQIVVGTVQRVEGRHLLINLGKTEAALTAKDQIPGETFGAKDNVRVYISKVEKDARGTHIFVSRTHPDFLKKLLETEIPEIQDKIIEIISISREPGVRAKVAVKTNNPSIGAVGTCVGHMGGRIQNVIKELHNEKIDILEWSPDPKVFIANSLKPAKINQVIITGDNDAVVVVANDQLSLAIGKSGVNVRLAVKLTNWKLDILNEEEYAKKAPEIAGKSHISIVEKIKRDKELLKQENNLSTTEI